MGFSVAFGRDSARRDGVDAYREQTERDGANELGDRDGTRHDDKFDWNARIREGHGSVGRRGMRREKARRGRGGAIAPRQSAPTFLSSCTRNKGQIINIDSLKNCITGSISQWVRLTKYPHPIHQSRPIRMDPFRWSTRNTESSAYFAYSRTINVAQRHWPNPLHPN